VAFRTVWGSQPFTESPALTEWARSAWNDVQIAYALRSKIDASERVKAEIAEIEVDQTEKVSGGYLYPFQRGGVEWLVTQRRAGLFDPQGSGKTPMVVRSLQVLNLRAGSSGVPATPALVIATGSSLYEWADKIRNWAPELSVRVVEGTAMKRRRALVDEGEADVYIIGWSNVRAHSRLAPYGNYRPVRCTQHGGIEEAVWKCEVHEKELNLIQFRTVIADEAHRTQDAKSKQTRAVSHLAQSADNFWALTGTPVGDTIEGFWPIGHAIDPKSFPAKSRYLDLFAIKNLAWHSGVEILGIRPDTAAAFHSIVQPLFRRMPREITRQGMPPRLDPVFRYPVLEGPQKTAYRQLSKELLADIKGHTMMPSLGVIKFGRLCQLAASSIELTDGEDAQGFTKQVVELALPSTKVDDLLDFLEDNPGQLVVAANSPKLVALAERKLAAAKISHCKIVGGMSASDKYQSARWFQEGQCRVIQITSAGSESIDLFAADTIYFMQPDPSFISRQQKIGRVDRIGQRNPVRVVYSISPGTVEERLFRLGEEKAERAESVVQDVGLMRWIIEGDDHDRSHLAVGDRDMD
jgi:SNF2 family DNA or RNA helicase